MAFSPQQIAPVDFDASVAVGVDIPFSGPAVFISNYQTKDAIKNNLINFFLTNPGERPLNPLFGGGLQEFIFEQITEDNLNFSLQNVEHNQQHLCLVFVVGWVLLSPNKHQGQKIYLQDKRQGQKPPLFHP